MSWLASIFVGIVTAGVGVVGTGGLGLLCVDWYRVPSREGGSGYMVVFLGLLGGVLGFFIGLISARIVAAGAAPGLLKALGVATGSTAALLAIATLICWVAADLATTLHGNPVALHAEIRGPADFAIPPGVTEEEWYAHIDTRTRRMTSSGPLRVAEARQENGRWIIPMTLTLGTSVREKLLYVRLGKDNVQLFIPIIPSKPGSKYGEWSDWQDGGWEPGKPRPEPAQRFNLRFRVAEVPPVESPPEPSEQETLEKKRAGEIAALAALTPESPLEECLQFTHYSHPEEDRIRAGAILAKRANIAPELAAEILSPDPEVSDRAVRAMAYVKPLPVELSGPINRLGENLIVSMESFNASKPEDDPGFQAAADISVNFFRWFQGLNALHDNAGVDGLPAVKRVLDLSLVRSDSSVMKSDVTRIAEYYVKEWSAAPSVAH